MWNLNTSNHRWQTTSKIILFAKRRRSLVLFPPLRRGGMARGCASRDDPSLTAKIAGMLIIALFLVGCGNEPKAPNAELAAATAKNPATATSEPRQTIETTQPAATPKGATKGN